MTRDEIARSHLRQAEQIAGEAQGFLENEAWNLVVRRSQEAVELALKAALRWAGVEVPRLHDVGAFLKRHQARFPEQLRTQMDRIVSISRRLGEERELSFYGDEDTGIPPEELYSEADAKTNLQEARFILDLPRQLIELP